MTVEPLASHIYTQHPQTSDRIPRLLTFALVAYIASVGTLGWSPSYVWISNYLGYGAAMAFLLAFLVRQVGIPAVSLWWFPYAIWMLLSALLVAPYTQLAKAHAFTMVQIAVLATMVAAYAVTPRRATVIAWTLAIASLFPYVSRYVGLGEMAQMSSDDSIDVAEMEDTGRFTGTVGQPNALAGILLYGAAAASVGFVNSGRKGKLIAGLLIAIQFVGIIQTGSRGGFLVFCFLLAISYCSHFFRQLGRRFWSGIALLAAILVGFRLALPLIAASALGERLGDTFAFFAGTGGRGGAGTDRIFLLQQAIILFLGNPLAGIGIGQFQYVSGTGLYPHNNFAVVLTETGLIGALLYFAPIMLAARWLFVVVRSSALIPYRAYYIQLFAVLLSVMAHGMFSGNWRHKMAAIVLGLAFGAAAQLRRLWLENSAAPLNEAR